MARMLKPSDYGILATLMSLIYIMVFCSEAIQNIVTKYVSKFNFKGDYGKIKNFMKKGVKKGFKLTFIIFLLYLPLALVLSFILEIDFLLLAVTGIFIFTALFSPLLRGTLRGTKRFGKLGMVMISESLFKLLIAIFLVFLGFKVYGAIAGVIVSIFISFFLGLYFIKDIFSSREENSRISGIYSYSFSFLFAVISITLLFSIDMIIARRIFTENVAGKYAVASILGKMIFFGTQPITKALFPISSETFENKKKTRPLLYKASGIVLLICFISLLLFLFFPEFIISLLFGSKYLDVAPILFFIGISFSILSLTNMVTIYSLSKDKKYFSFLLPIFAIIEAVFLLVFGTNLLNFSFALIASNIVSFFGVLSLSRLGK
jgi:O-antigen/teichoic acid export membrane protein